MRHVTPLPTLAALIADVEHRNGWADTRLVARASAAGYRLTTSDISAFRTLGMRHVNPEKVMGLAEGLGLPAYRVVMAIFADFGVEFPGDVRTPEDAVAHDHTLSAHTRESVRLLLARDRETH